MDYLTDRIDRTKAAVDQLFVRRIERHRAPSAAYAVFDRNGVVYGNGFGAGIVGGPPPSIDTAYRIASCTKSFTAATALLLRDRGMLSLDDPIGSHLPSAALIGAGPVNPTIGQLLRMAGGLPSDDPWADRQESLRTAEFDALLSTGVRFVRAPGLEFEYSNLGYAMLGRAIEAATGSAYIDVVTRELLGPLSLAEIGYHRAVPASDGLAHGYRRLDDEWVELPFSGPGAFSPIGGLFATPRALASWARWLASAFDESTADEVLSASSRREMQTIRTPIEPAARPVGYGYGLNVGETARHGRIVSHSGGYPGFGAHMRWHAGSGIGIVAMENATYSGPYIPAAAALTTILDETMLPDGLPELWPETHAARLTVERLVRQWDLATAAALFADNVDLDETLDRRGSAIAELARAAGIFDIGLMPLSQASPYSDSAAHLAWTIPGSAGSLRCEIRLTPQQPPLVQTMEIRAG